MLEVAEVAFTFTTARSIRGQADLGPSSLAKMCPTEDVKTSGSRATGYNYTTQQYGKCGPWRIRFQVCLMKALWLRAGSPMGSTRDHVAGARSPNSLAASSRKMCSWFGAATPEHSCSCHHEAHEAHEAMHVSGLPELMAVAWRYVGGALRSSLGHCSDQSLLASSLKHGVSTLAGLASKDPAGESDAVQFRMLRRVWSMHQKVLLLAGQGWEQP